MAEGQKSKIWGLGRPMCAGARVRGNSMLGARKGRKEPFGRFPGRQNAAAEHLGEIRSAPREALVAPAQLDRPFFGLELALGPQKSVRIAKIKKYGFFRVNLGTGYFFDFPDSGPCGLPGGFLWQKSYHPAGCRLGPFLGWNWPWDPQKVSESQK